MPCGLARERPQDEDVVFAHQATRHTRRSYWEQGHASRCRCHRCSTRLSARVRLRSRHSRCCWRCITGTCRWRRCSPSGWGSFCSRLSSVQIYPPCACCSSRARWSARRRTTRCFATRASLRSTRPRQMAARLCSGLPRCRRVPTQSRPRSRSHARSRARCSRTAPMRRGWVGMGCPLCTGPPCSAMRSSSRRCWRARGVRPRR